LHLQQTFPLLCLEPYKHPKTTNLNLNTTKEEGDGNKLPLPSSLEHQHKKNNGALSHHRLLLKHRKEDHDFIFFFCSNTEKKVIITCYRHDDNLLPLR
jgi:hypothetical protein